MSECFEVSTLLTRALQKAWETSILEFDDQDSTRLRKVVVGCDAMLLDQVGMIGRNLVDL